MIYCFDVDGTICTSVQDSRYTEARPHAHVIKKKSTGSMIRTMS